MEQRQIRHIQAITIEPGAKMQKCWRERETFKKEVK